MTNHASGTFEVKLTPQGAGRMSIDKQFRTGEVLRCRDRGLSTLSLRNVQIAGSSQSSSDLPRARTRNRVQRRCAEAGTSRVLAGATQVILLALVGR